MADIAKCNGTDCELRDSCYRFVAPAARVFQSWISTETCGENKTKFSPIEEQYDGC